MMELDRKDFALLEALQKNASTKLEELAKVVGLATSSVHERVQRLQRSGVIRQWSIDVDAAAVGLPVMAFIGVKASRPCSDLMSALEKIRYIEECHSVAGELSMILKVRVPSPEVLLEVTDQLRKVQGIEATNTTLVLKTQLRRGFAIQAPVEPRSEVKA